jgi:transcriptional/translational regulatory protein YebC/TACO1
MEIALENGGDDVESTDDGKLQVTCSADVFDSLGEAFQNAGLQPELREITRLPQTTVDVDATIAKQVLQLLETLDGHDDVQNVSTNLNITSEMVDEAS